jgi:hypothetical protein
MQFDNQFDNQQVLQNQDNQNIIPVPLAPEPKKKFGVMIKFWLSILILIILALSGTTAYFYYYRSKTIPLSAPAQINLLKLKPFPLPTGTVVKVISNTKTSSGTTEAVTNFQLPGSLAEVYNRYLDYFKSNQSFSVVSTEDRDVKKVIVVTLQLDRATIALVPGVGNTDVTVDIVENYSNQK